MVLVKAESWAHLLGINDAYRRTLRCILQRYVLHTNLRIGKHVNNGRNLIRNQNIVTNQGAIKMKGYVVSIEKETTKNTDFRRVLYTGKHSQLVVMSLKPGKALSLHSTDILGVIELGKTLGEKLAEVTIVAVQPEFVGPREGLSETASGGMRSAAEVALRIAYSLTQ